jgi:hypothetical protein
MVVEEIVNATADTLVGDLVVEVGKLGLLLNALGVVIILWIGFQIVTLIVNRKRRKALYRMERRLDKIEKKLDKALKR